MFYDHIVVGAGIVGSCTALTLAKKGQEVLLLEQFTLPHTRGSSHGQSRLIRTCYSEEFFARMMGAAFDMWKEIEEGSGLSIIEKTGVLCMSKEPFDEIDGAMANLKKYGATQEPLQYLDEQTMREKYPFVAYDMARYRGLMDPTGGVIKAANALRAVQALFKANGGKLQDASPVTNIVPGAVVKLTTAKGQEFATKSLVLCCGSWTEKLLKQHLSLQLPLQAQRVNVFYFCEKERGSHDPKNGVTAFLDFNSFPCNVYGLPSLEYPGHMKVCVHLGTNCDPDRREQVPKRNDDEDILSKFISTHLPGLENKPAIVESCMYTVTPDESFIIDKHPKYNNITIGAGFSGTGFKLAPVTGLLLAQLATGEEVSYNTVPFAIARFLK